jgi:soluble lytic murein transglycosylase
MLGRYRDSVRSWTDPVGLLLFRLNLRPNHLTLCGLGVSLLAAACFVAGRTRTAGVLLILAGLFDFFDGSLARASGQVTPFGAFLDSVIDRYSDLVVLLGIVVLFARTPHARGAVIAMAGLVGSVMVSYTKARAESIGVECTVGVMERPERMICLIAGALLDLLEPALWVLAILANVTALQRIAFTRRAMRGTAVGGTAGVSLALVALLASPLVAAAQPPAAEPIESATERAWGRAVEALQQGDADPVLRELAGETSQRGLVGDYTRWLLADALARRGDLAAARAAAQGIAERYPDSRLAPASLLLAATLAARAGDDAGEQALIKRLLEAYPDAAEIPEALYLLGMTGEARGQSEAAAHAYRELQILVPASGWAAGASDRLAALAAAGVRVPELSIGQRVDRAERLLRGGAPRRAADEAEQIVDETRDTSLALRALKVVADASQRLGRHDVAARAIELAVGRAPADRKPGLRLEQARLLLRAGQRERALTVLASVEAAGAQAEAAEAALLKARTLDEPGQESAALAAYKTLAARFAKREVAGAALWRVGWIEYVRGDVRGAERTWSRLLEIPGGRAYRLGALYWTGRALERTGRRTKARQAYERILRESPRSYYGMLSARRVATARGPTAEPSIRLPADPHQIIAADPGFARVDLLRRVGLTEFALLELEEVVQRSVGDPVRLYAVSSAYVKEERYHLALRILRRHLGGLTTTGHPDVPRAFWEMVYPFGWRSEVSEAAEHAGLDPFFVAAVVREESSYYPRAVSRAGARGLMQLMPATAQPLAENRGLAFRNGLLLDEPGANLQLGASFLAAQLREFGDPRVALAAYNAGPRRARQWWQARKTDDVDAWVEQIPYDETRRYVKRVMFSWEEYRRVYGPGR